jgi:hypothetical protein
MRREHRKAVVTGLVATAVLAGLIFLGSRNLRNIDAALIGYTFATLFAVFGIAYRYSMWLQRPPTRMYWRRGWQAFLRLGQILPTMKHFLVRVVSVFALNLFIWRRSKSRGLTHVLMMWGCLLAGAVTFPLVFGWLHFETVPGDMATYRVFVFGWPAVSRSLSIPSSPS